MIFIRTFVISMKEQKIPLSWKASPNKHHDSGGPFISFIGCSIYRIIPTIYTLSFQFLTMHNSY